MALWFVARAMTTVLARLLLVIVDTGLSAKKQIVEQIFVISIYSGRFTSNRQQVRVHQALNGLSFDWLSISNKLA